MKKFLAMMMVAILTLGVLAACGPQRDTNEGTNNGGEGTTTEGTDKPESLAIWVNDQDEQSAALEQILKAYEEETGIEVKMTKMSMLDQLDALELDAAAGRGPDVFFQPHDRLGDMAIKGIAAPINLGDDANLYSETAINALTFDGEVYGVPQVIETYGIFYNKDLVSEEEIKTIEGLMEVAEAQTDAANNKFGFVMNATDFYFTYPFLSGYGGYVFEITEDGFNPGNIGLDNEGAVKGGELIQTWYANDYMNRSITDDFMNDQFQNGNIAAVLTGPWRIAQYKEALGDKLGSTTLPELDGKVAPSFVGVKAWFVNAYSKNQEWAVDLMKFITKHENAMKYYEMAGEMPALQTALESDEIVNDEIMAAFAEQTQYGQPMPNIPQMSQVWEPVANALGFIADGDDPQEVLEEAVQQIKDRIQASGGGN